MDTFLQLPFDGFVLDPLRDGSLLQQDRID
jgi:hypothetical protein